MHKNLGFKVAVTADIVSWHYYVLVPLLSCRAVCLPMFAAKYLLQPSSNAKRQATLTKELIFHTFRTHKCGQHCSSLSSSSAVAACTSPRGGLRADSQQHLMWQCAERRSVSSKAAASSHYKANLSVLANA
eukprot:5345032-Pleurochrysis_carterae.AAC.3